MRTLTNCLLMVLVAGALACSGCGKSDKSTAQQGLPATIDVAKFQQVFPSPTPEQQNAISKALQGWRYGMYMDALVALDKLATDPSLTEPQKKAVSEMIEGVKQTMSKVQPAPAK